MFVIPYGTREHEKRGSFPYVTMVIVAVNIVAFLIEVYLAVTFGEQALANFLADFAVIPTDITDGTPFEAGLLTSMFLHAGLLHLAGNLAYLLPFGDNVEDSLGHFKYLLFYVACGIAASAVHILFNPGSNVPALGASGAIAGVLGGYLALHPRGTVKGILFLWIFFTRVDLPAIVFILFWFVMQLFSGIASLGATSDGAGVAFWAHVGGFIAGLLLAPLLRRRGSRSGTGAGPHVTSYTVS